MQLTYDTTINTKSATVNAAFALANQAHAGQSRGKQDKSIGYIVHPIILYKLLLEMGVEDELTLASALLHDVKEDNSTYKNNPSLFVADLTQKLIDEGVGIADAHGIAAELDVISAHLTNPSTMIAGKRMHQVRHAGHLSPREAKVKLLDQTASLLGFIMKPNDETFPNDRVITWNNKALNVVRAIVNHYPELKPWENLHKVLLSYAERIIQAQSPEAEVKLRNDFCWGKAMRDSKLMSESLDVPVAQIVLPPNANEIVKGIISVSLSEDGKVVGYSCLTAPDAQDTQGRNAIFSGMIKEIESPRSNRVLIGEVRVEKSRIICTFVVEPPMDGERFIAIGKKCQAIEQVYGLRLQDAVRATNSLRCL